MATMLNTTLESYGSDEEKKILLLGGQDDSDNENDVESQPVMHQNTNTPPQSSVAGLPCWILLNIVSTVAIVFLNKSIFDMPSFRGAQLIYAAFHLGCTFVTLHVLSLPAIGFFTRQVAPIKQLLPLAGAMALNVLLLNLALARSSVTFYQTSRILLTPCVAILNYFLFGVTVQRLALAALITVCIGVGMVTYFDTESTPGVDKTSTRTTSAAGVAYAFAGVLISSLYMIWTGSYAKKFQISSVQLLYNTTPLAMFGLFYFSPWLDTFPQVAMVGMPRWILVILSGLCACAINVSSFIIIGKAGPVTGVVVGHSKTCCIVILGWVVSGRTVNNMSMIGCAIAIVSIIMYSFASLRH